MLRAHVGLILKARG